LGLVFIAISYNLTNNLVLNILSISITYVFYTAFNITVYLLSPYNDFSISLLFYSPSH